MRPFHAILALIFVPAAALADPPQDCRCRGAVEPSGSSTTGPSAPQRPGGPGRMGGERGMSVDEHGAIRDLLGGHAAIARKVEEIPDGVRTTTTTTKPELVETLRTHVRQMSRRLEQGRPVRMWDPVFRGVFAHADEIKLTTKDIEGGIEVTETSSNPAVVTLIRAHAAKVSDFVARGHAAARPPWAGGGRGRMRPGR
jgi:hypothetical protein